MGWSMEEQGWHALASQSSDMTSWERFFFGALAVVLIIGLAGCEVLRAGRDACLEGLCR